MTDQTTADAVARVKAIAAGEEDAGYGFDPLSQVIVNVADLRAVLARLAECERDAARTWECWVNVYPDGAVYPYTSEVTARRMLSKLTGAETVRARLVEVLDDAAREGVGHGE